MCEYLAHKANLLGMKNSLMRLKNGSLTVYLPGELEFECLNVTLDVQRSEQFPAGYMRYIRHHSFIQVYV